MPDERAHFLALVGDICHAARVGHLSVELTTASGRHVAGVPGRLPDASEDDQVDDTGYGRTFRVDDALVALDDVRACTVHGPAPGARGRGTP